MKWNLIWNWKSFAELWCGRVDFLSASSLSRNPTSIYVFVIWPLVHLLRTLQTHIVYSENKWMEWNGIEQANEWMFVWMRNENNNHTEVSGRRIEIKNTSPISIKMKINKMKMRDMFIFNNHLFRFSIIIVVVFVLFCFPDLHHRIRIYSFWPGSWAGGLERCYLISHHYLVLSSSACVALCSVFPPILKSFRILSITTAQHEHHPLQEAPPLDWQLALIHNTCKRISRLFLFLILSMCKTSIICIWSHSMLCYGLVGIGIRFCVVLCIVWSSFGLSVLYIWMGNNVYLNSNRYLFFISSFHDRKTCEKTMCLISLPFLLLLIVIISSFPFFFKFRIS